MMDKRTPYFSGVTKDHLKIIGQTIKVNNKQLISTGNNIRTYTYVCTYTSIHFITNNKKQLKIVFIKQ